VECIERKYVALYFIHIFPYKQRWNEVLWDLKFAQFLGFSLKKEYKITNTKLGIKVNREIKIHYKLQI